MLEEGWTWHRIWQHNDLEKKILSRIWKTGEKMFPIKLKDMKGAQMIMGFNQMYILLYNLFKQCTILIQFR